MKTIKEASDDLGNSSSAFDKLADNNVAIKRTKSKIDEAIDREANVFEELQRGLNKAKDHSDKLMEQVWFFFISGGLGMLLMRFNCTFLTSVYRCSLFLKV